MTRLFTLLVLVVACDPSTDDDSEGDPPTWYQDVAPIVSKSCVGCHSDGGIGPFALDDYASAAPWATAIADSVASGRMPPWGAQETDECAPRFDFKDDLRLTADQIATLEAWADGGAPEGDSATAASLPSPVSLVLDGATHLLSAETAYQTGGTVDEFICFVLDPGLTTDGWITGVQVQPGNSQVVHHALIFTDSTGSSAALANEDGWFECAAGGIPGDALIGAWAPGSQPFRTPDQTAMPLAAGGLVVMQIHYHPTGDDQSDLSGVDLLIDSEAPTWEAQLALIGNFESGGSATNGALLDGPNDEDGIEFRIPADVSGHTESMEYKLSGLGDGVIKVFSAGTHMHYVGTDMRFAVRHDEPIGDESETECLVQTPDWDFNWQRNYSYDAELADLPELRNRDTLLMDCTYDNTVANAGVVQLLEDEGLDAPTDVYLGEETSDEMCLGVAGIVFYEGF
jgi:hypothetical protein